MARLKAEHKEFIVNGLARFKSKTEIQKEFEEEYSLELAIPQISFYDPETRQGAKLADKWRHMFYAVRRKHVEKEAEVPIFHKAFRLHEMQANYDKAKKSGNLVLCQQILEQAAKEAGGMYEKFNELPDPVGTTNFYQQVNNIILKKDGR